MTSEQRNKCHGIIHTAAAAAGAIGLGLAQLPCSDFLPLIGIQVTMIISLGKVFNKTLTRSTATSIAKAQLAAMAGRYIAGTLVGWLPGYGNVIKAGIATSVTEAIGWHVAEGFEQDIY